MLKTPWILAALLSLPATASAGLLQARAGGPARPLSTGTSVGVVADYFAVGEVNQTTVMADLQIPVGMPLRVRVPLAVTGSSPIFDKAGPG